MPAMRIRGVCSPNRRESASVIDQGVALPRSFFDESPARRALLVPAQRIGECTHRRVLSMPAYDTGALTEEYADMIRMTWMGAQLARALADLFLPVLVTEWSGLSFVALSTTCGLPRLIRNKPSTIVEAPTAHFTLRSSPKQSHPMTAFI